MKTRPWFDPLGFTAVVAILIVGLVATADILQDGMLEPGLLALLVSVLAPLTPALIVRAQKDRKEE